MSEKVVFGGSQNILIHNNWIIRGNFHKTQNRALYIVLFADSCCTSVEVINFKSCCNVSCHCFSLLVIKTIESGHNLQGCNVGVTVSS